MPGWGHHRHTHAAAETIPSDMIISGLGTRLGSGTEGWGENRRHLYWVLAASSLLKVGLKTPKEMDFSSTLLNGAAFYKQPKNFKILPACSLCPCPSPLAEALGSWRWPSLHQLFLHLPVPPGAPLLPCHCQPGSGHSSHPQEQLWGTGPCLENLVFRF